MDIGHVGVLNNHIFSQRSTTQYVLTKETRVEFKCKKNCFRVTYQGAFFFLGWHLNLFSRQKKIETFEGWDNKNTVNTSWIIKCAALPQIASCTKSIPSVFCLSCLKIICKRRNMRAAEHAANAHIWGVKKCLEKGEKLLLIRLCAPFVAKSAGGVWEKQFYKSLELGNTCPEGGGRTSWFHCNCMGQNCTMHIYIFACVQISAIMQICKYACTSVQLHEWRKSAYLCLV